MSEEEPLISKITQAYQVIGWLAHSSVKVPDDELARALDYFADDATYDPEFLPWPRFSLQKEALHYRECGPRSPLQG